MGCPPVKWRSTAWDDDANPKPCFAGSPPTARVGWRPWSTAPAVTGDFPPAHGDLLIETVRQEPRCHGIDRSRWRCADLREVHEWLASYTTSGIAKALRRLKVRLKRGRLRLHSPDPAYAAKKAAIDRALALARTYPERVTLIYGDEVSGYRQPTLGACWFPVGTEPTATLSTRSNTRHRLGGGLNAVTGQVTYVAGHVVGVDNLIALLRQVTSGACVRADSKR